MSDPGKTKAEMLEAAVQQRDASYDAHVRKLVEKWMAEIRAISLERNAPPLMRT